ncbi:winged helix-turn-helix domain-containing protein [Paenibacillus sp. Marseille-Q4541]|uniref:winged helix-turn-helix domain-containing protein n=1 Tax=Paenibacillus sp. Marseille-Q4541 TaxID=2831522 RepID=UPI001BA87963|nr:winged helix-turn-helix domain-containing protein [Paenibacillus sp. Marseille-Q4541]
MIDFDEGTYSVITPSGAAHLLAKEYALLTFLHRHQGQTFTREHLLNKVWGMEYPSERTVDDHIYRLRKKLVSLPEFELQTVRGTGYRLTVHEPEGLRMRPSLRDPELQAAVDQLFQKYHLLGQGESMLTLAAQQEVLGIEVASFYSKYLHFLEGDLAYFVHDQITPVQDQLYWISLLYGIIVQPEEALQICEKVLQSGLLSPRHHREMYILNIIDMFAENGRFAEAEERLIETHRVVKEEELSGFHIPVATAELYLYILENRPDRITSKMEQIRLMLEDTPYLREMIRFHFVAGIWQYAQGLIQEAVSSVDQGMRVYYESKSTPHLLISLGQFMRYIDRNPRPAHEKEIRALRQKLSRIFADLNEKHQYDVLLDQAREKIMNFLASV